MSHSQAQRRARGVRRIGVLFVAAAVLATPSRLRSEVVDGDDDAPAHSARGDLKQLEKDFLAEKDEKKRAALVAKMTWLPGAPEVLQRIVATDPSDDVAFAAGNAWRRVLLGGVVGAKRGGC